MHRHLGVLEPQLGHLGAARGAGRNRAQRCVRDGEEFDNSWLDKALDRMVAAQSVEDVRRFGSKLRAACRNHFFGRPKRILSLGFAGPTLPHASAAPPRPSPPLARPSPAVEDEAASRKEGTAATCYVCLSKPSVIAAIPCGHVLCCEGCLRKGGTLKGKSCYACRATVQGTLRIYF